MRTNYLTILNSKYLILSKKNIKYMIINIFNPYSNIIFTSIKIKFTK